MVCHLVGKERGKSPIYCPKYLFVGHGSPHYRQSFIFRFVAHRSSVGVVFIPYFRFSQYRNAMFRQTYLASVLLFVVLFSTGSESSSYIIAISGACIWYLSAPWQRNRWDIIFMVLVLMISGFGSSDLYPRCIRHDLIQVYSLKALPCTLVWLKLCYEMMFKNYASADVDTQSEASKS